MSTRKRQDLEASQPGPLLTRIAINPQVCEGRAVVRGTEILVSLLLDRLAAGKSHEEILTAYPQLNEQDLRAVLAYAAALVRGPWFDVMDEIAKASKKR